MDDGPKKAVPGPEASNPNYAVPRRYQRYQVPAEYLSHIILKVKMDAGFVPVIFHNFSSGGILFESRVPFEIESHADCVIAIPRSLSREVTFSIRVIQCEKKNSSFLVGATIETADDTTWLNIIREVHDFIVQWQGDI